MKASLILALLLSSTWLQDVSKRPVAPPQARAEIERHRKTLEDNQASYYTRLEAIQRLAEYEYAEAVSALLTTLQRNIAEKLEQRPELSCTLTADGLYATSVREPKNYHLVKALTLLKAKEALPILSEMLALDDEHRGLSTGSLITHIISIKRVNQ